MVLIAISLALASLGYVLFVRQLRPWACLVNYSERQKDQQPSGSGALESKAASTEPRIDDEAMSNSQRGGEEDTARDRSSKEAKPRPPVPKMMSPAGSTAPSLSSTQLMPPPPPRIPRPSLVSSPNRGNLAPPNIPRGPLPNRGPLPVSRTSGSLLPPPSISSLPTGMAFPNKPTRKVILEPGHSPLDWAHLTRTSANLSGVESLQRITKSQLALQNGRKGKPAWSAFQGKVYNITPYLPFHPGGKGELMRAAGKDGGDLFMEVHPWVNWDNMLGACLVGFLVSETDSEAASTMDQMD